MMPSFRRLKFFVEIIFDVKNTGSYTRTGDHFLGNFGVFLRIFRVFLGIFVRKTIFLDQNLKYCIFKEHPIIIEELDLVEEDDQFTHMVRIGDEHVAEEMLNVFKPNDKFLKNEKN